MNNPGLREMKHLCFTILSFVGSIVIAGAALHIRTDEYCLIWPVFIMFIRKYNG